MRVDGATPGPVPAVEIDEQAALRVQDRCNTIVRGYQRSRISKSNALAAIRKHIPCPNGPLDPLYTSAVEAYSAKLEAYDEEIANAARHGDDGPQFWTQTSGNGSRGRRRRVPDTRVPTGEPNEAAGGRLDCAARRMDSGHRDAAIERGLGRGSSSPPISRSIVSDAARSRRSPSEHEPSSKRQKFDESKFPWVIKDVACVASLHPDLQETLRLLKMYLIDPRRTKQALTSSARCPELPDSEWTSILAGRPVDLDIVFSGHQSSKLVVRKASKQIVTHQHWFIAWTRACTGIQFAFPHRAKELTDYGEYISSLFTAVDSTFHSQIIGFDKALRHRAGARRDVLLTDYHEFEDLKWSWLTSIGTNVASDSSNSRSSQPHSAKRLRSTKICRDWNSGTVPAKLPGATTSTSNLHAQGRNELNTQGPSNFPQFYMERLRRS